MTSVAIFAKKDYVGRDGQIPLYLRLTINRKTYPPINLNRRIRPDHWDDARRELKASAPNARKLNMVLQRLLTRANEIILDHELTNRPITFDSFKAELEGQSPYRFEDIAQEYIRLHRGTSSPDYVRKVESVTGKLLKYAPDLQLFQIDYTFLRDYNHYLATGLKNCKNTIYTNMRVIRRILTMARKKKLIKDNPFEDFPLERVKVERPSLTPEELFKYEQLLSYSIPFYLKKTLCWFLLATYTGRRYGDIVNFKKWVITDDCIRIEQSKRITSRQAPKSVVIFINDRIRKVLQLIQEQKFEPLTNTMANRFLKEVNELAGVSKRITFHCSRHTFNNINKRLQSDLAVRRDLLGHDSIKSTMEYEHTDFEALRSAMLKWNGL